MTFEVKTYRGSTLGEALQEVHKELGDTALILSTRSLSERAFLGLRRKEVIEITARMPDKREPPARTRTQPLRSHRNGGSAQLIKRLYKATPPESVQGAADELDDDAAALQMEAEITEVRSMVQDLVKQARYRSLAELPQEILTLYSTLIELEIPEAEARRQVQMIAAELPPEQLAGHDLIREVQQRLDVLFKVCGPLKLPDTNKRPYAITFFGPAGAGKTSAMIKLAGMLMLQGRRVALVSVDPYRMDALEQVQQYAQVLGVPFRGAMTPDELNEMLREMDDVEVALIDTAGRSQRNHTRMEELRVLLGVTNPQERHLVMPATLSRPTMCDVLTRYRRIGYDRLLVTKLDETVHRGCLVELAISAEVPFSYLSAGQKIPDDLMPATSSLLSKLTFSSADLRKGEAC